MHKWNLLKKTAPCILSLAVAATTFPTAVMATDLDAAVVSETEDQAGDTEDLADEEPAADVTGEDSEAAEADIAEDVQSESVTEELQPEETTETAEDSAEADEFTADEDVAEAFADSSQLTGEYQYVYAGLTWDQYWASEGVYAAGDTSSSDVRDSHNETDKGAFDTVTRATANHGVYRGSYQAIATLIAEDGTTYAMDHWKNASIMVLTDGTEVTWGKVGAQGAITTADGVQHLIDHYEIYGLKYVPVAVKTSDYADFCKQYNVVTDGEKFTCGGSGAEGNVKDFVDLVADVNADTNGLKYAEKNGDGFTFSARRSGGTSSGIKDQALKTVTDVTASVQGQDKVGSFGEFLRVDLTGAGYGELGASMQAVRWNYYGSDETRTKALASYGTKFAADNWMHSKLGIQLGLTDSARCQLPGGTDGTGYWSLTVYALGYNDYTVNFEVKAENLYQPTVTPADKTDLTKEVETAKALKESDYTKATWAAFAGELAEAEELLAKENPNQPELNEALEHLQLAEKALVKVKVTFSKTAAPVYVGKTVTLKATVNETGAAVKYTSSNTKVATVSSTGVVKGVKAGTTVITATYGSVKATCKVTVKAASLNFVKTTAAVYKGKTVTVKATAAPAATVKYKSSNTKVATVTSKGVVKGVKAGTVTITATAGKLKATCKVTVKNPTFSLVKSSATIAKGKTTTIRSKAAPAGKVTYTSSNKKIATVTSKGVVKGIRKGKATITVKCNGITKKFVVTVK